MRRGELQQIRTLRRQANCIAAARRPVPARLAAKYHQALDSLKRWEDGAQQDGLGFGPLALLLWGGSILSLAGIGYVFAKVVPEVVPSLRRTVETVEQGTRFAMWAILGLGVYNLATKGKVL